MGRIVGRAVPNIGILLLAALLASGIHAQESGDIPEPQSSVIMPMATEALLLDATRIDEKIVAVGDFGETAER